jgi:hypothetical protein
MITSTRKGWFSRVGDSFGGVIFGILLFLGAFALLFWNEGRAVKRARDLEFGAENVVKASAATVNPKNEGKLIHVSGAASAPAVVADPVFGVQAKALRLARETEMYQWKEKSTSKKDKKLGGSEVTTTEYTYQLVWNDSLIDSGSFQESGHENPSTLVYDAADFSAQGIKLGAYALSPAIVGEITPDTAFTPAPAKMPAGGKMAGSYIYLGESMNAPKVGDVRISYKIAPPGPFSVVAGQQANTLIPFADPELNDPIVLLEKGTQSAEAMFKAAEDANAVLTLVLRFVGFLMMFFGLRLMSRPLSVLADLLPFLGSAVGFLTGFVSFFIAIGFSVVTIAIAWIFYRPLIGILLLLVAVGAIAAAIALSRKASKA